MSGTVDLRPRDVRVASASPGRIRLRAHSPVGRDGLAEVAEAAGAWPEVTAAQLRPWSLSLVIDFDPARTPEIGRRLDELGVGPAPAPSAAPADPARAIGRGVASANGAVARRLDGTDLRTLVPLGLGLLAARRAMRGDERLADAPWYVLAWYASETFLKFHGGAETALEQSQSEEE